MLQRPRRNLEVLTISALDLFASALGVFILMSVLLFPFYLKQPSLETLLEGAQAELSAAADGLRDARRNASSAAEEKAEAEAEQRRAADALKRARDAEAAARDKLADTRDLADAAEQTLQRTAKPSGNFAMPDLDLVFVMDATGSMGNELRDVQTNLLSIIRVLSRLAPTLNVGFVAYKDQGEEYLARRFPLKPMNRANATEIQRFVEQLAAGGGGDYPEPVGRALQLALDMDWRSAAEGRIIVVGDAPAHQQDRAGTMAAARGFQRDSGGTSRKVSAIFTGSREEGRRFFRELAESGGGDFVNHRGRMIESVLLSVLAEE